MKKYSLSGRTLLSSLELAFFFVYFTLYPFPLQQLSLSFTYVVFSCLTTRESNYYYFIEQILAKYLCFCFHSNLNCFCC